MACLCWVCMCMCMCMWCMCCHAAAVPQPCRSRAAAVPAGLCWYGSLPSPRLPHALPHPHLLAPTRTHPLLTRYMLRHMLRYTHLRRGRVYYTNVLAIPPLMLALPLLGEHTKLKQVNDAMSHHMNQSPLPPPAPTHTPRPHCPPRSPDPCPLCLIPPRPTPTPSACPQVRWGQGRGHPWTRLPSAHP